MNENDVRLTYRLLGHRRETEVRLIDPRGKPPPKSIFVHSEAEFLEVCRTYEGLYNIYVGMNERRTGGTTAADVESVNAIVIDVDPIRPKDEASTDAEMAAAVKESRSVQATLREKGLECLAAMSGNGAQLWTKVHIQEELARAEAGIKAFQRAIMALVDSPAVRVDNMGDLPRIIKVIGTLSVKGSNTPERPHRTSTWLDEKVVPPINEAFVAKLKAFEAEERHHVVLRHLELTDEELQGILARLGPRSRELFEGRWQAHGYPSRSEAEMALATALAMNGIGPSVVAAVLARATIGKWSEAGRGYRELTLSKAYAFARLRRRRIPPAMRREAP